MAAPVLPTSLAFRDAVERAGQQPGPWADQGAVLHALGRDRGDERYSWARPGAGNGFSACASWLPTGWNTPYVQSHCDHDAYNSAADSSLTPPTPCADHLPRAQPPVR